MWLVWLYYVTASYILTAFIYDLVASSMMSRFSSIIHYVYVTDSGQTCWSADIRPALKFSRIRAFAGLPTVVPPLTFSPMYLPHHILSLHLLASPLYSYTSSLLRAWFAIAKSSQPWESIFLYLIRLSAKVPRISGRDKP